MSNLLNKIKSLSTTKLLISFLFLDCIIIQCVVIIITFKSIELAEIVGDMPSFTPLVSLIGAVVSEVIGFGIYCAKSAVENTKGGIVYDNAMKDNDEEENEEGEGLSGNG